MDVTDEMMEAFENAYWKAYDVKADPSAANQSVCIRAGLVAAAPAMLAAERERIAVAILARQVDCLSEDSRAVLRTAADIARGES
jgi:hypothetical protein